ncbi:MAG: hypothetical protein JNM34_06300 [Chthonomonadaceae bacterium]|nr:hypothetical protein [Chthonomonadaceae bacterium]
MNKYWNPRMQPLRKGPVEFSLMGSNGVASSSQRVFYSGGKASGVGFVVSKTEVGVRCLTLVGSLLLEVAAAKPMVVTDKLTPVDKLNAWALAAKEDRNVLEEIGINGLYRAEDEGLISWPQWEANCIERSARIKQRLAQKKQAHQ